MGRLRAAGRRMGWGLLWVLAIGAGAFGYGLDGDDARLLNEFCGGVERWQAGPEFRQVAREYVRLSHAAMNATPWGASATRWVMAIRSVPGLPPEYAVSPSSQPHYDNFTRGELSAYLHLSGEQAINWVVRDLHRIATDGSGDADVEAFLRSWKMNRPVAADAAAVAGVKRMLADIDAARPIEPRANVQAALEAAAGDLANRLGYPRDPRDMTPAQQRDVLDGLDADLRERDHELWRLKQVSDLCAGIWAQTFGEDYTMVIEPVMTARGVCRVVGPAGVVGLVVLRLRRRKPSLESGEV